MYIYTHDYPSFVKLSHVDLLGCDIVRKVKCLWILWSLCEFSWNVCVKECIVYAYICISCDGKRHPVRGYIMQTRYFVFIYLLQFFDYFVIRYLYMPVCMYKYEYMHVRTYEGNVLERERRKVHTYMTILSCAISGTCVMLFLCKKYFWQQIKL
jgi:hypothetical protein